MITARILIPKILHLIAVKRTKSFEKNPAKGGIPAMENSKIVAVIANIGFATDSIIKSVK